MGKNNSYKEINQASGVLRKGDILRLPVGKISSSKGPVMKRLILILVGGPGGPQGEGDCVRFGVPPYWLWVTHTGPPSGTGSIRAVGGSIWTNRTGLEAGV